MVSKLRFDVIAAGLAALAAVGACTSHDVVTTVARPGKFQLYSCDQLNTRGGDLVKRERELQDLIQKASQGPGGAVAIALAYQNEYNTVQGDLREVELTGAEKKCVLKHRSISEQAVR